MSPINACEQEAKVSVALLGGNTGAGVYHEWPQQQVIIDVKGIPAFTAVSYAQVQRPPALRTFIRPFVILR